MIPIVTIYIYVNEVEPKITVEDSNMLTHDIEEIISCM